MNTIRQLIDELGGPRQIAKCLGITTAAVNGWVYNMQIPFKHFSTLIALAATNQITITHKDLERINRGAN